MVDISIKELDYESIPYNLLLLADDSKDAIEDYISRGRCYGAYINQNIVGIYVLLKTRSFTIEIVNIAVKKEYQNQGIGKKMVLDAINRAKLENFKVLEVGTGNCGICQLALYQKCGFRITHVDRDFFNKHYEEKIIENGIECVDMIRLSIDL
ncbi:MAG: GNAT family N-acetyltransferase [Methanobacterium sp.]|uniref:GNAT family N-acetyltransferase n=1 Tax=Methanobacterium sp. TaxID=2164 RepID=UPI003D6484EC|nr:GNAT family N-acetyltransferase [Methanobacterium sp.]